MAQENQELAKAIGLAHAENCKQETALPPYFSYEQRAMLLDHYTGLAMQATLAHAQFGYGRASADSAVAVANEQVRALERFYQLASAEVLGRG